MPVLAKRILLPREGNTLYPLPPDYFTLTTDGRRQARIAALRQFTLYIPYASQPPSVQRRIFLDRATALTAAVNFFDRYYLWPDEAEDYDPGFYDLAPSPSPAYHDHLSACRALHARCFFVGPRGSAKTGYWKKAIASSCIAVPHYSWLYITSLDEITESFGDETKTICYDNPRANDDFTPEYGAPLKPKRGEARTGMKGFTLVNGSWVNCTSAQSRKRGKRPIEIAVDDPEWDPTQSTPTETLRANCHSMLTRVLIPMIQRPGCRCTWTGTFISRKLYLWYAMSTKTISTPSGPRTVALDKTFSGWARMIQPAEFTDPSGVRRSCWSHMWPIDEAEKIRLNLPADSRALSEIREELGDAAYSAEYLCNPDAAESGFMPPLTEESHGYSLSNFDAFFEKEPWRSGTHVTFTRDSASITLPLHTLIAQSSGIFILADTSATFHAGSDFKCGQAVLFTDHNELFVLDLFHEQCDDPTFEEALLRMADRWHANFICPEEFGHGESLLRGLEQSIAQRIDTTLGITHLPEIVGIRPANSKCSRISAIRWRFTHNLIKLPWSLLLDLTSPWHALYYQITNFQNLGGDNTGLEHDDAVDTTSMSGALAGIPSLPAAAERPKSLKQLFIEGTSHDPTTKQELAPLVLPFLKPSELQQALANRERAHSARTTSQRTFA